MLDEQIKCFHLMHWKNSTNKPVKNADLWMQLDEAVKRHDVRFIWVLGHNGHVENERADKLACRGRDEAKLLSQ